MSTHLTNGGEVGRVCGWVKEVLCEALEWDGKGKNVEEREEVSVIA